LGFVSYGSAGGARAIEQLRLVAIELAMWPIRNAIRPPRRVPRCDEGVGDPRGTV